MTTVDERRWPAWKICYFALMAVLLLIAVFLLILGVLIPIFDPGFPIF